MMWGKIQVYETALMLLGGVGIVALAVTMSGCTSAQKAPVSMDSSQSADGWNRPTASVTPVPTPRLRMERI